MSDTPETDAITEKRKFLKRVAELTLAIELYVDKLESERDSLAAQIHMANERLAAAEATIKALQDADTGHALIDVITLEALRKGAARYRWVRMQEVSFEDEWWVDHNGTMMRVVRSEEVLDKHVDSMRQQVNHE